MKKAEKARKTRQNAAIRSQRELAGMVGRNESQVSRWLRDERWVFGPPPWPARIVPDVLRWIAQELKGEVDRPQPPTVTAEMRKLKLWQEIRRLTAQADLATLQLERERAAVVPIVAIEEHESRTIIALREMLRGAGELICDRLRLPGCEERDRIKKITKDVLRAAFNSFLDNQFCKGESNEQPKTDPQTNLDGSGEASLGVARARTEGETNPGQKTINTEGEVSEEMKPGT